MSATSFDPLGVLAARAERLLARWVAESSVAERLVAELDGQSFVVAVEGLSAGLSLTSLGGRIRLELLLGDQPATLARAGPSAGSPARSVTLRATPLDLLKLLRGEGLANLRGTQAELTGNLHVAEQYAALFRHARPDLEEEVARFVGDYAASELGAAAARARTWLERAAAALAANTTEYLQEEAGVLPSAVETRAFYADVERLRDDVERAAERLRRLAVRPAGPARPANG